MADNRRKFEDSPKTIISIIFIMLILFNILYNSLIIFIQPRIFWSINMLFVLAMVPLLYPAVSDQKKSKVTLIDIMLIIGGIAVGVYACYEFMNIEMRGGIYTTTLDVFIFILATILIIENTRRVMGWALPILALIFLIYGLSIFNLKRIGTAIFSMSGIFGLAFSVSITWIFVFLLFGSFLNKVGVGNFMIDLARSLAGRSQGGPAKIATVASALFGTISGSAVANVSGTGVFTIPMMKKMGFEPKVAGAVEAVASTGGQIMPPIMGAGAFIMAELIGIPYSSVCKAAIIPALLYYTCVWFSIDLYSKKNKIGALKKEDIINTKVLLRERGYLIVPVFVIIYLLFVSKIHPITAALWSTIAVIILGLIKNIKEKKITFNFKDVCDALENTALQLLPIMIASACVGLILAVLNISGIGLTFGNFMILLSDNVKFLGNAYILPLFMGMLVALVFGMGLPTTISYLICAAVIAPAYVEIGFPVLRAHLFIFYYAILSGITPPVAMASYTGATIADANFLETAVESLKFGFCAFFLPYSFIMSETLIMKGETMSILIDVILIFIAIVSLSSAFQGWLLIKCSLIERILFFISGIVLFFNDYFNFYYYFIFGLILFLVVSIFHFRRYIKKSKAILTQ